ncbi:MAG TPA: class I SAM-dependent methyltransferase [Candidatus Bathyarchaeia archaeon]|nr:class I SAM-dependent methyltransferase [Candidatus Bathyarchaeia archaeon]
MINTQNKVFGLGKVSTKPWVIPALGIKYCFNDLKGRFKKGDQVLDIGCGGGSLTKFFKKRFPQIKVWGCDLDKMAIRTAKENCEGVKFVAGNILNLPFKDKEFKVVIGFHIWEHLTDLEKAAQEIGRILRKDGIFHLAVPIEGDFWTLHGWLTKLGWQAKKKFCGHIHYFSRNKLIVDLEKQGFKLIKKRNSGYLLFQLADVIFFALATLRKKAFAWTVEGYLEKGKKNLKYYLTLFLRIIFALLTYTESRIFRFIPGYICHLTFVKKRK